MPERIGGRALLYVARRQWPTRWRLVALVSLLIVAPLAIAVAAATVSASAAPRPGELTRRSLGPYDVQVTVPTFAAADTVRTRAAADGARTVEVLESQSEFVRSARSGGVIRTETGTPDPRLWQARFELVSGSWPGRDGEACLSADAAELLAVGAGGRVSGGGTVLSVRCVYRDRSDFSARSAVVAGDPATAGRVETTDAPTYAVYAQTPTPADAQGIADGLAGRGYDVLLAQSLADQVEAAGSRLVTAAARVAWILLLLSQLAAIFATRSLVQLGRADSRVLYLQGFDRRARQALALGLVALVTAVSSVMAVGAGTAVAWWARSSLEQAAAQQWFGFRPPAGRVAVLVLLVEAGTLVSAAVWTAVSAPETERREHPVRRRRTNAPLRRLGVATGSVAALTAAIAAVSRSWTVLLVVAPLAAVSLAVLVRSARTTGGPAAAGSTTLLARAYSRRVPVVGLVGAALTALLFAFPVTAVLTIRGLDGDPGDDLAAVPRSDQAVYVGTTNVTTRQLADAGARAGATSTVHWRLAGLPTGLPGDPPDATSAAVADVARRCVNTREADTFVCAEALRGVGLATQSTLETVVGRPLSRAETEFWRAGGALVLDDRLRQDATVRIVPVSGLAPGTATPSRTLPARRLALPSDTRPSGSVPSVWLSSGATSADPAGAVIRPGQAQAAFVFDKPVDAATDAALRRALTSEAEFTASEEFLVDRTDAGQVNVVRAALARYWVLAMSLALVAAAFTALTMNRDLARYRQLIVGLGLGWAIVGRTVADVTARSVAVGVGSSLVAGIGCAEVLVRGETGAWLPLAAVAGVAPTLLGPVIAVAVGLLAAVPLTRRRTPGPGRRRAAPPRKARSMPQRPGSAPQPPTV